MPKIERYKSRVPQSGASPNALATSDQFTSSGKLISDVGNALGDLGDGFVRAHETAQKQTAMNRAKLGINEILTEAANDPNPENTGAYARRLDEVKRASAGGISLRGAQDAFDVEYTSAANDGLIKLRQLQREKIVDLGVASISEGLNQLDADYLNASPDQEIQILNRMDLLIQEGYANGFMSAQDKAKMIEENLRQVGAKKAVHLINSASSPEEVLAIKDALLRGDFEKNGVTIDPEKKKAILTNVDTALKKKEEQMKEQQVAVVNELGERLVAESLTAAEVENAVTAGLIDAEMGTYFQLAILGPKEWKNAIGDEKPTFAANNFMVPLARLAESDDESRVQIVRSALQNYSEKKLAKYDLAYILRVANGKTEAPDNAIWGFLKSAVGMVAKASTPVQTGYGVMQKFKARWNFEDDPRTVMKEAMIDQQKEERPETADYKIGDMISRKGRSFKVVGFDDDGKPRFKING
jgi:hypothetical protein